MSRGDRRAAAAAATLLGGCMRIYPDPELPDVLVEWFTEIDCEQDTDRVVVTLSTIDPAAEVAMATAPCRDGGVSFPDVARLKYAFTAQLQDGGGGLLSRFDTEIDLRDGLSERVNPFFGRSFGIEFRAAWTFDMGASCESLQATSVVLRASRIDMVPVAEWDLPCELAVVMADVPFPGTYTLSARALAADVVVATSPESAPRAVIPGPPVDFGTLVLSPCGSACPRE